MNCRTINPPPPPPPPPTYVLELSHAEMLHLAVVLYRHESFEPANLLQSLPSGVQAEVRAMTFDQRRSWERAGWRDRG